MAYTNEYKEESDIIARFMREYIHAGGAAASDPEQPESEPATWPAITNAFQDWKRTNEIVGRGNATDLRKRLEAQFGKYPRNGWTSFRCGNA